MSQDAVPAVSTRELRKRLDRSRELKEKGWYHSFLLPDGTALEGSQTLEFQRYRLAQMPLPEELRGKRVLDIGAWDGWFSFEMEKRGAQVTAIDCVEMDSFLRIKEKLSSQVEYRIFDVYELPGAGLGTFNYVLFLAVLYHLKHPLLALEIVCGLTREAAIVESFVTDAETWQSHSDEIPTLEFYETDELGGQLDNWNGPSVSCLMAMCRAAGFGRVELLRAGGNDAAVACYRRWEPVPDPPSEPAPLLEAVVHNRNSGINFYTAREEHMTWWFRTSKSHLAREDLRLEVDGLGVPAVYAGRTDHGAWMANSRLPPGLTRGWKQGRMRLRTSDFSNAVRIAVDLHPQTDALEVVSLADGVSWEPGVVWLHGDSGFLTCWLRGLGENCDRNNVRVLLGEQRIPVNYVGEEDAHGLRQVNLLIPASVAKGRHALRVVFGGVSSPAVDVEVR